jgi:imidazolonepropionase-like amidohydrolase
MWFFVAFVASLAALWARASGAPTPFAPAKDGQLVLFLAATLIDGTGAAARANVDVLVDGERIRSIAAHGQLDSALTAKARVIDLTGRYLMPGLIDAHVHMATPPNRRQAEAMLRRDLYGGVTAVRDMADDLRSVADIARASRVGEIAAPDVYYAALMAGPDFFTDERTRLSSEGGVAGQVPWMQAITDRTDLALAVAEARGTAATAIKLYADLDGGLASKVTAEAHRQHLLVWAHATLYPARPSEVIAAGVDTVSHACLLVRESAAHVAKFAEIADAPPPALEAFAGGDNPVLARVFATMAQRGTILDATVWTYGTDARAGPPRCDAPLGGAITGQAYRAGVPVAAGTDKVMPATDRWPELLHELDALVVRAGMPVAAALHSATLINARAAGQERDMGSLEPGKLANMIVLTRNPLDGLENLKSIAMTVKRGRVYSRRELKPLVKGDVTDLD